MRIIIINLRNLTSLNARTTPYLVGPGVYNSAEKNLEEVLECQHFSGSPEPVKMSTLTAEHAKNVLSSTSSVMVHSGNVASWNKLRRKGVLTSTDEVSFSRLAFLL